MTKKNQSEHVCPCDGEHDGYYMIFCVLLLSLIVVSFLYSETIGQIPRLSEVCEKQFGTGSEFVDVHDGLIECSEPDKVEVKDQVFVITARSE